MKIPLIDLRPTMDDLREEILEAVTKVIDSKIYIMGPEVANLEKEITDYCSASDSIGVSSGTDALLLSLNYLSQHAMLLQTKGNLAFHSLMFY